ncbi:MAG: aldo/keto reductase, partial [Planctomycetota bacterium]|nr:aldo/keto reductase [Planctomycetota bacterium]
MERRQFLRTAAAGVGAAALVPSLAWAAGGAEAALEHRLERPGMTYRRLGRTNLNVSRIVHGSLHTNRQRIPLLARLYEAGVNWFDTAWLYGGGRSEEALGEFFSAERRRDNIFISTKANVIRHIKSGKGTYAEIMKQVETSLRRLRTDHVEIAMLHGSSTLIDAIENEEWLRAADDLKKHGKTRFIGFSEHAKPAECLAKAAATGRYDVAMVAFSLIKGTWGSLGRA